MIKIDEYQLIPTHNCQRKSQCRISGHKSALHNMLLHMIYRQFNVSTTFPKLQHQDTDRDFGAAFFLCTIDGLWVVLHRGFSLKQKIKYCWCRQTLAQLCWKASRGGSPFMLAVTISNLKKRCWDIQYKHCHVTPQNSVKPLPWTFFFHQIIPLVWS